MKRLAIFSSFDTGNQLSFYVKVWLLELKKNTEVIFVTNQRNLLDRELDWLESQDIKIEMVLNEGYDFGMWYKILKEIDLDFYDELLLCNDSCILFKGLDDFYDWVEENPEFDVYGMTDSCEIDYHLQSFFILYKKTTFNFLNDFFQKWGIIKNRNQLIHVYEIGLSKQLKKNGYKLKAKYEARNYTSANISLGDAENLIIDGIPFIKKRVIYNNFSQEEKISLQKTGFPFLNDWKKVLSKFSDWDVGKLIGQRIINILQIYFEPRQAVELLDCTIPYFNQEVNPFFENKIIKEFYERGKIVGDYFGVLSWKFYQKNNAWFDQSIFQQEYDMFIAPIGLNQYHDVLADSEKCHPGFSQLFQFILNEIGIDPNIRPQLGIYQNAVIAKTEIYRDYCENFLIPTIQVISDFDPNSKLYERLWSNTRYEFDKHLTPRIKQNLGVPYYPFHTFLCERLWSVYYHLNKDKIKLEFLKKKRRPGNFDSVFDKHNDRICIFSLFDEKDLRLFSQFCEVRFGEKIYFSNTKFEQFDLLQCFEQLEFIDQELKNKKIVLFHSDLFFHHIEYLVEYFPNIQFFLPKEPKQIPENWDERLQLIKKLPLKWRLINPQRDFHFVNALKIK